MELLQLKNSFNYGVILIFSPYMVKSVWAKTVAALISLYFLVRCRAYCMNFIKIG